jgi:hypothetical protein
MTSCFLCYFIIKTISTWECTPDGIYGMLNKWNEMKLLIFRVTWSASLLHCSVVLTCMEAKLICIKQVFRQLRVCWCGAPSPTRSWVCSFQFLTGIAIATWDSPNLGGQFPIFISPRNRVAQLYPRALGWLQNDQVILRPTDGRPRLGVVSPFGAGVQMFHFFEWQLFYSFFM